MPRFQSVSTSGAFTSAMKTFSKALYSVAMLPSTQMKHREISS